MKYEEALAKIHSFQTFGSRLGLSRMRVLMNYLGDPQDALPTIHVAGTNGKGSVCRYLAEILRGQGYHVGLYTSPYLEEFNERIEYDGEPIAPDDLAACAARVFSAVDRMLSEGLESPTEFEVVTAIGFVYFRQKPLDFLVLEVGLGGTGDSTNLVRSPLVSVVTSISYDHMDVLGDTLEAIAAEKAGIFKPGCPVVSHVKEPGPAAVIRKIAAERDCPYIDAALAKPRDITRSLDGYGFTLDGFGRIELGMIGLHQIDNAVCALHVVEALEKRGIIKADRALVRAAMTRARQKGRLEILRRSPCILIDGAHNEAGAEALASVMEYHFKGGRILLVLGVLADKKADRILDPLLRLGVDAIATEPDNPRRLPAAELCRQIRDAGTSCRAVPDWADACRLVDASMDRYDAVLFSGSLYLIGRIRGWYLHGE